MAAVFAGLRPDTFLSVGNFQTIFGSQTVLLVLALALLVPLIAGEFDLSVASTLGLAATLVVTLNGLHDVAIGWAIAAGLAASLAVGVINAALIVWVGVDAIVVTLGMGTFLIGMALWTSNSLTVGGVDAALTSATNDHWWLLPRSFYYGVVLTVGVWFVSVHTPLGRYFLFVGQGREVARLSGVPVNRVRALGFLTSAGLSGIAGVMAAGTLGAFQPSTAVQFLLPAFAAAFLGSAVVSPGRFNAWGAFIAIYFIITGITGLQLLGLSGWVTQAFYGGALVVAVTVSTLVRTRIGERAR